MLKPSMILKDEEDINKMINVILDRFENPFVVKIRETEEQEQKGPLIKTATRFVASDEATKDFLGARKTGETCLINYVKERLNSDQVPMSSNIKQLILRTFASQLPKMSKSKTGDSAVCDTELFGRLLVISNVREVNLEKSFTYELTNIPLSFADPDNSLAKTNKARTLRDLEDENQSIHQETLATTAIFIDHMACVQKMSSRAGIHVFDDVLKIFMGIINEAFKDAQTVHIVSDKYDTLRSITAGGRKTRGSFISAPQIHVRSLNQVLPKNMKNYLANPQNKDNLNDFTFTELEKHMPARLDKHQMLVLGGGFQNHE